MSIWPFHNYTPVIDWKTTPAPKPAVIQTLPKRSLPTPKQPSKTDRIKRSNSKV